MNAADLYKHLQQAVGPDLKPSGIDGGRSFFWREKRVGANSTRVLRVHENASGLVSEIKLPVTSLRTNVNAFMPLPATYDDVAAAVRAEIDLLES